MNNDSISNIIKDFSFDLVGITNGEDLDTSRLKENIISKEISSFESRDLALRSKASLQLENVQSIFVFAMSYYWEDNSKNGKYKISKYSRGLDYHQVLKNEISKFDKRLKEKYRFYSKIQVDTGPLMEKALAVKAGLGQVGKNTLVINKDLGSYFFIGLLLTDLKLQCDNYHYKNICKACNKCVEACPTGALLGDGTMDPKSCLSYLSQTKEENKYTSKIKLAYGCDICQDVCPYNDNVQSNLNMEFKPRLYSFDEDIKTMSNNKFKKIYKDFAFSWVGRKIIVRNMEIIDGK